MSSPNLLSVVTSLIEIGRVEESVEYLSNAVMLAKEKNVDNLAILGLTIEEYIELMYPKPLPKVKGRWDNIVYGEAAFK